MAFACRGSRHERAFADPIRIGGLVVAELVAEEAEGVGDGVVADVGADEGDHGEGVQADSVAGGSHLGGGGAGLVALGLGPLELGLLGLLGGLLLGGQVRLGLGAGLGGVGLAPLLPGLPTRRSTWACCSVSVTG